ncbi:monocarboxylate transporter [Corynespora cassiicola Philippines]|uniref:Monocarboxylate transporter n=1 Tax=Corynespora cassiicola Philippines TaxID=1448308 RepID=A0A2T2P6N5_CORCC|nr:monocarboxylate transporter [Corynespora cassiicola Philippines]
MDSDRDSALIELRHNQNGDRTDSEEQNGGQQSLPRVDGGPQAWKFLFASVIMEAVLWGYPLCFGVFQDYYTQLPEFKDNPNIALIGTLSTGIYFLGAPVAMPLVRKFQNLQRHMVIIGWIACVLSTLSASFCQSVSGLIATQGVAYGVSFLLLYFPLLCMLNEWFVARRGLAYGVLYGGGGLSGGGLPFMLSALLERFGYQTTLRAVAVAQFILVLPFIHMVKGRLPASAHSAMRKIDLGFFRQPLFYCFAISNILQGLGYYIPALYLPTFASALGLSSTVGALVLALNNLATVLGQVCFGWISDRTNRALIPICISSLVASGVTFFLWGFAHSLVTLIIFAFLYGLFAGGFVVFWPKFGTTLSEDPQAVFSLMAFGRGIGNVVTGPIASALVGGKVSSGYALGRFLPLVIFLGTMMFGSSLGILGLLLEPRRRRT